MWLDLTYLTSILYLLTLFLSINITSWWWMWIMFEMMTWIIVLMMESNFIILFLLLQSLFSLFIVFSLILLNHFVTLFFFSKMGLPPFHFWVVNNQMMWSMTSFFLFISLHKWLPTIILMNYMTWSWSPLIFMILSVLLFWLCSDLKSFFFSVSINDMGWMMFSWIVSIKIFLLYLLVNLIYFVTIFEMFYFGVPDLSIQLLSLFLINFPPFLSFLMKWMILSFLPFMCGILSLLSSWFMILLIWYLMSFWLMMMKANKFTMNKLVVVQILSMVFWM